MVQRPAAQLTSWLACRGRNTTATTNTSTPVATERTQLFSSIAESRHLTGGGRGKRARGARPEARFY